MLRGALLGLSQWWVLRQVFPEAGRWFTALGYGLGMVADLIAARLVLSLEERRALLEDLNPDSRIERVCQWLDRALLAPPRPHEGLEVHITPIMFQHAWGE
jgi:hypothetical protein